MSTMKIADWMNPKAMDLSLTARDKKGAIEQLVSALAKGNELSNESDILTRVLKRESQCSTSVGHQVAFPHAQIPSLESTFVAFGKCPEGVPFDAPDGQPVKYLFLIVGPDRDTKVHLMLLATLSRMLNRESFRSELSEANTSERVMELFQD